MLHRGVRVDGEEIFLGDTRHVRGFSGKEDEHTCEVIKFYDQTATGNDKEMVADVRWYYQPKELNSSKVKNMPDKFLPNEVILSDDHSPVNVEAITKKCFVAILDASKVPRKMALNNDTLYYRWRLVKGEKHHLVPAIPVTPKPTEDTHGTNNSTTNMKTSHKRSTVMASKNSTKTSSERSTKKSSETTIKKNATVLKKVTEVKKALTKISKVHQASSSLRKPKVRKNIAERSAEGITSFESARERYVVGRYP